MTEPALSVADQAKKIELDCERAAVRDALVSTLWNKRNLYLGLSATVAAAAGGVLVGSGNKISNIVDISWVPALTAFLSLASAVLASSLTFLAPSEKANSFQQSSNKYHALRERIRFFRNNRCSGGGADLEKELQSIITAKQEIDVDHPILPEWAYRKAQKKIKEKILRNQELERLRSPEPDPARQSANG